MQLTKTDFVQFLHCSKSLWLMLNKPDIYPFDEPTDHGQKLIEEGYLFESYVEQLIRSWPNASEFTFQKTYETDNGLFARLDVIRSNSDGSIDIYEIKSSSSVKKEHLADAAFQAVTATRAGAKVGSVFIVHLTKEYTRQGEINPAELITIADETVRVKTLMPEIESQMNVALALLDQEQINETSCTCLNLGKNRHCNSFDYFNPNIPSPSIYNLPRMGGKKLESFVAEGRFNLDNISLDEVTRQQAPVLAAHQNGGQYINLPDIENFFSYLKYPLYFLDYEAYGSAIPAVDELKPHAHLPFQFSLHVLTEDGTLTHHEYLANEMELPIKLVEALEAGIGPTGSVLSWYKTYENSRNKDMAQLYPEKAEFLNGLVSRTLDLMDIFTTGYVDIAFGGSTSIKKVLPVVVPELSYEGMDIADGTAAMAGWANMIEETDPAKREKLRKDLLEYCKLDTLAMVKIFEFVEGFLSDGRSIS